MAEEVKAFSSKILWKARKKWFNYLNVNNWTLFFDTEFWQSFSTRLELQTVNPSSVPKKTMGETYLMNKALLPWFEATYPWQSDLLQSQ